MTQAERIPLCYSIHLLTFEVKMESFREGLQGTEWLLYEEEVNLDSLDQTSNNRVFCNQKWQELWCQGGLAAHALSEDKNREEARSQAQIQQKKEILHATGCWRENTQAQVHRRKLLIATEQIQITTRSAVQKSIK